MGVPTETPVAVTCAPEGQIGREADDVGITRADDGAIINTVDLEAYLYSVVTREMSP